MEKSRIKNNFFLNDLIIPLPDSIFLNRKSEINPENQFEIILEFMYSNNDFNKIVKKLTSTSSLELLSLSISLGINRLSKELSSHIISNFLKKENCLIIYLDSLKVF